MDCVDFFEDADSIDDNISLTDENNKHIDIKMDTAALLKIASSTINKIFTGEPTHLSSFVSSVQLLESLATTNELRAFLVNFVKSKLEGRASELVNDSHTTVKSIIEVLTKNIKFDNSKVLEGRILAFL